MNTRLSCYEDILLHLTQYNCLTRKALLLMNYSNIAIYNAIAKGIKEKTIKESVIKYRKGKGASNHQVTCFSITRKGLALLHRTCADKCQWLEYLPDDISGVRVLKDDGDSNDVVVNFLRMTSAAMMAEAMGGQTPDLFIIQRQHQGKEATGEPEQADEENDWLLDDEPPQSVETDGVNGPDETAKEDEEPVEQFLTLCDIVRKAKREMVEDNMADYGTEDSPYYVPASNRFQKDNIPVTFHDSRNIKRQLLPLVSSGGTLTKTELTRTRFSGLLESCSKTVLVYVPNANGIVWHKRIVRQEMAVARMFSKLHSQYHSAKIDEMEGIMIVQNEKMLDDVFSENAEHQTMLGTDLKHLWIVPMNKEGAVDMKWVMTKDWETQKKKFLKAAVGSGVYELNSDLVNPSLFPLKTKDGTVMANGTLIDVRMVNKILLFIQKCPDTKYGIICRKHQYPYYQRIMPNAICMLVR